MKKTHVFPVLAFSILWLFGGGIATYGQEEASLSQEMEKKNKSSSWPVPMTDSPSKAMNGEEVRIAIYQVKPEKKEAFEKFVRELLWPATYKAQPEVSKQIRFWIPRGPSEDGKYRYAFVFDPYFSSGEYGIEVLLTEIYGEEKAGKYMDDFATYVEGYDYWAFMQEM